MDERKPAVRADVRKALQAEERTRGNPDAVRAADTPCGTSSFIKEESI